MNKKLKKFGMPLIGVALAGAIVYFSNFNKKDNFSENASLFPTGIERIIQKEIIEDNQEQTVRIPVYDDTRPGYCAQYIRKLSEDLDGRSFPPTHAWNVRYLELEYFVSLNVDSFLELSKSGKLEEGMVIGIRNPNSKHNSRKDETGNKVMYTHLARYCGNSNEGPLIAHNYNGGRVDVADSEFWQDSGLIPVEAFRVKGERNYNNPKEKQLFLTRKISLIIFK